MLKFLDVVITVKNGDLYGAYRTEYEAMSAAAEIDTENEDFVVNELGYDLDGMTPAELEYAKSYEGDSFYYASFTINPDDVDGTVETDQGDEFSVREILDAYEACRHNIERDTYYEEEI